MHDELVNRLKIAAEWAGKGFCITPSLCLEAANAIEELTNRNVGKWIELPSACNGAILTQCSSCRRILSDTQLGMVKRFCPNCGAKMEGVIHDV